MKNKGKQRQQKSDLEHQSKSSQEKVTKKHLDLQMQGKITLKAMWQDPEIRKFFRKTVIIMSVMVIIFFVTYLLTKPYFDLVGNWFQQHFGLWGVFVLAYLCDALILPFSADILFTVTTHYNPFVVIMVVSLASICGGFSGFLFARWFLRYLPFVRNIINSFVSQWNWLIKKYNTKAVIIAALTPIPFSVISWVVGMLEMKWYKYLFAALFRIPRMAIYYVFITGGLSILSKIYLHF